jgi:four helix bundle protein
MRDHRRLEVFRLADSLVLEIYRATKRFPDDERYGLTSQLRRAAVSVSANIVEGAARRTNPEFSHLLNIAYSSACEVEYQISLAVRLGYVSSHESAELALLAARTCRALRSLVEAVRSESS